MLETLRSIVQEVNAAPDLQSALAIIVSRVKAAVKADVCSIYLTDEKQQRHLLQATDGFRQEAVGKVSIPFGKGLVGLVYERAEPLNLSNAIDHPRYLLIAQTGEFSYHGFLGVPIIQFRQVLGVLVVRQKEPRSFAEEEETFLLTLAAQLAGAIGHASSSGELAGLKSATRRNDHFLQGRSGSAGVAIGKAVVAYKPAELRLVPSRQAEDPKAEVEAFRQALLKAQEEIERLKQQMLAHLAEEDIALFDAWAMMLRSESLEQRVLHWIAEGCWAPSALRRTIEEHSRVFEAMEDPYMRERALDVRDLGRRILGYLQASSVHRGDDYPVNTILVGEEVSAAQLAEVPLGHLAGILCATGSSSSHVAILARAMGIPAVMGVADAHVEQLEGCELILDGFHGRVHIHPAPSVRTEYQRLQEELRAQSELLEQERGKVTQTRDGCRVHLYLNTGLVAETTGLGADEAEGVGLYRTELPFMVRDRFPGEEVQRINYRRVLKLYHPRPVTLRTLDIGGDKDLPYFPIPESNPFLGWRGIRISLDHPEIFLTQIRAMLRASEGLNNLRILLPMISHIAEVVDARRLIDQAFAELTEEGLKLQMPAIGAMIEVPAAVFQAAEVAAKVDFISLGTNDLTQYLLAVDRNNPNVADLYSDSHPAVLKAINLVYCAALPYLDDISVCGEMAGDPLNSVLLVGMGYRHLSMSAGNLLKVRHLLRHLELPLIEHMTQSALCCEEPAMVRALLEQMLSEKGLLHLVRPTAA